MNNGHGKTQCSDGKDNDGDGLIDFPADPGCTSLEDDSEDSQPAPQCNDGRDNDGDGKIDYPDDPGCFAPNQDDEKDNCPDGADCPQCGNGKDDDMNGLTDYPNDPGCTAASDTDEYTENPLACGANVMIKKLPPDGHVMGTLTSATSQLNSMMCGGPGAEDVYELRIMHPKVVVATTDMGATTADTVLYIRGAQCSMQSSELACNDDISTADHNSKVTYSIATPGTYYLVVDTKSSAGGSYDLNVQFLVGEGDPCQTGDDCGPGLVCRVPLGGSAKVCAKHVCQDGVDDDGDGKPDYPTDPGCASPTDDDETDDCPSGPNCPECGDGRDNDGDGHIDYPADTQCQAASSTSEACATHEIVPAITAAATMGDTTNAVDDFSLTCGGTGDPDLTYRIDVPALATLNVSATTTTGWFPTLALFDSTCGGTALACTTTIAQANVAAGTYYLTIDGEFSGEKGPFTLNVSGQIKIGQSCEGALAVAGALTCVPGSACAGTAGSRTCQPAACNDGIDNDHDGKIDYPNDPGCDSPSDNDEANPATLPVCSNMMDDDADGTTDWPNDYGCSSAAGTSEVFCSTEHDPTAKITTKVTTGTTTGKAADEVPTLCATSSTASDVAYGLQLPVPVASLTIDLAGSAYDTVLYVKDTQCGTELYCNDDSNSTLQSALTLSNLNAGGYAIIVDGYSTNNGAYTLTVHGTVDAGVACTSPLFSGGANAVLSCPTSCVSGVCH
ncbi:MAG: hypothetical protein JO257_38410 [Deltaproteobacteria bacterium]|nr:hypothetical protein [Deltaproteobacteria bacterium]